MKTCCKLLKYLDLNLMLCMKRLEPVRKPHPVNDKTKYMSKFLMNCSNIWEWHINARNANFIEQNIQFDNGENNASLFQFSNRRKLTYKIIPFSLLSTFKGIHKNSIRRNYTNLFFQNQISNQNLQRTKCRFRGSALARF